MDAYMDTFSTRLHHFHRLPPTPYPNSTVEEVWRELGHGHYGTMVYEYTVELPLDEMEQYYEVEMEQYCADGWQFTETELGCQGYVTCRTAECEIPRLLVKEAQFFSVYLRSISEARTNVRYSQKTINP
jgi:hypothetical protein